MHKLTYDTHQYDTHQLKLKYSLYHNGLWVYLPKVDLIIIKTKGSFIK